MRSKKEIEKELKKYDVMDDSEEIRKRGLYKGHAPLSEWAYHHDVGFREALRWVLNLKT